jgi:hypothetical protein
MSGSWKPGEATLHGGRFLLTWAWVPANLAPPKGGTALPDLQVREWTLNDRLASEVTAHGRRAEAVHAANTKLRGSDGGNDG